MNDKLARGLTFFVDIANDGIALYEEPGHSFAAPQALACADEKREARTL
ncbi:MAG: hypothetical protein ACK4QP_11840 [Pseudorhizobium sp.]